MTSNQSSPPYFFDDISKHGDALAVISDGQQLSYIELAKLVDNRKEELVLALGKHKQTIGMVAQNTLNTLVSYLALLQLRQVIVFVASTGRTWSELAQQSIVQDYHLSAVLFDDYLCLAESSQAGINAGSRNKVDIHDSVALLLNTSGSTGASKQVVISYRNMAANTMSICAYLPIENSDICMTTLPFHYSYGLSIINTHLAVGAAILMTSYSCMQREFWQQLEQYKVSSFGGVPHSYDMLLKMKFTEKDLPSLRYFTQAGGKLAASKISQLASYAQRHHKAFFVMYGQTEATARMGFANTDKLVLKPDTIGRAIPDTQFYLLDEQNHLHDIQSSAASQLKGELVFSGENVMLNYARGINDLSGSALMADNGVFIHASLQADNAKSLDAPVKQKMLRTGDLARVDSDGDIFITGRLKRIIKLAGERISLDDIDTRLLTAIEKSTLDAKQTLVVCSSGNDSRLDIVFAGENFSAITQSNGGREEQGIEKDLVDICKPVLKSFGIHSKFCRYHFMPNLPLTNNGKVDYASLLSILDSQNTTGDSNTTSPKAEPKFEPTLKQLSEKHNSSFTSLLAHPAFSLVAKDKDALLSENVSLLHDMHSQRCSDYANICGISGEFGKIDANEHDVLAENAQQDERQLPSLPFLAVRLFKQFELASINKADIFKVLSSSGTTGQSPARILLDQETSARQSKTLVNIMQSILGKQRLPMLIVDTEAVAKGRKGFSARTAGIQGLSFFGRKHVYALHDDMTPNWPAIEAFFTEHANSDVLIFGFTFMIWLYLIKAAEKENKQFSARKALIVHSGGWKKLESEKVDNKAFKQACAQIVEGAHVHNFYGMAEQVGSIFVECSHGHLHAPNMADLIIRDPYTFEVSKQGEVGLIQVLSALPTSYPGHSLLTEDMGRILGEDNCLCGWKGKYFEVLGRLPKAEVRGCSDTHE
ncbi:AMP-binding protein [Glaciecola sp. MH2013]|uniref:LuxE/PaaK family acyltransferase n=1 Tax=Glaciecola sp. MH2013 TaxID=2785524 RepID=UPI0018A07345|nr:AMP-binding protein [Glaciecola sp. MH2013]MBF7072362.1 AMP-binding protein [Glaciecola sp. MH2013]